MASQLAWLDQSERDRRRMHEVIGLFREHDTRDELGIGAVRDAIADLLFPGTSTIQTRARYFLFVPWIYSDLERKQVRSSDVAARARKLETQLIEQLKAAGETEGVIGIEAGKSLKRLPSSIYWQGLASWGIRLSPYSQDQYHRSLDRLYSAARGAIRTDDGDIVVPTLRSWHSGLPAKPTAPERWASLRLTRAEAEFFQERILTRHPGTMLASLVDRARPWEPVSFPWDHERYAVLPVSIRRILLHGRNLSLTMNGAAVLYNFLVAKQARMKEQTIAYRERFGRWAADVTAARSGLRAWDRADFWRLVHESQARVGAPTRTFITQWLELALSAQPLAGVLDSSVATQLITAREQALKGVRARITNSRARELWSGAAGLAPLNYRWHRAQRIVLDILEGLESD